MMIYLYYIFWLYILIIYFYDYTSFHNQWLPQFAKPTKFTICDPICHPLTSRALREPRDSAIHFQPADLLLFLVLLRGCLLLHPNMRALSSPKIPRQVSENQPVCSLSVVNCCFRRLCGPVKRFSLNWLPALLLHCFHVLKTNFSKEGCARRGKKRQERQEREKCQELKVWKAKKEKNGFEKRTKERGVFADAKFGQDFEGLGHFFAVCGSGLCPLCRVQFMGVSPDLLAGSSWICGVFKILRQVHFR